MVQYEKGEETITIFSEVPGGKSSEEIEKEFEKIKLFGFRFKSIQKAVFKSNKKGGG